MKELGSGKSIRIRSSESVRVDHCLSAPLQLYSTALIYGRGLTDNIIKITSSRNSISGVFMERSKVSTKSSVSLNIEGVLFSEDYN